MSIMIYPLDNWFKWEYVNSGVGEALHDLRHESDFVTRVPNIKLERDLALEVIEAAPNLAAKRALVCLMREHPDEAIVISV